MPSLPVASLKNQYTAHNDRYPAQAPITAPDNGIVQPTAAASRPAQSNGSVSASGSTVVSQSIIDSAISRAANAHHSNATGCAPNRQPIAANSIAHNSSTNG